MVVWSLRRCVQPVASIRSLLEMFDLIFKIENQRLCAHSLWELRCAHSYGTRLASEDGHASLERGSFVSYSSC